MADSDEEGAPSLTEERRTRRSRGPRKGEFEPSYISEDGRYTFMIFEQSNDSEEIKFRVKYKKAYQTELAPYFRPGDEVIVKLLDDGVNSSEYTMHIISTDGVFHARSPYFHVTATIE